jgi:hypothetical protein
MLGRTGRPSFGHLIGAGRSEEKAEPTPLTFCCMLCCRDSELALRCLVALLLQDGVHHMHAYGGM